jgi:hypothetical protein
MSRAVAEASIVKADTAAGGEVWTIEGDTQPDQTGYDVERYVAELPDRPTRIRVIACRENADLIAQLYRRQRVDGTVSVQVGRPPSVQWADIRRDGPGHVLLNMRQFEAGAPSMGGWHDMTDRDYPSYAMASLLGHGPVDTRHLMDLLDTHPAWDALSFIPHLDRRKVATLLARILDPRWFVDPEEPDSSGRLNNFLGLIPSQPATKRKLAMSAWIPQDLDPDRVSPGAFLLRYCDSLGNAKDPLVRTTRRFVAFLRYTWTDAMAARPRLKPGTYRHDQGLFIPEYFFRDAIEAGAFRDHMAARAGLIDTHSGPP